MLPLETPFRVLVVVAARIRQQWSEKGVIAIHPAVHPHLHPTLHV